MVLIDLTFHQLADDENIRELCRQYWSLGEDGRFKTTVGQIAEDFNIPKHEVAATVALYCTAFSTEQGCTHCGTPRAFGSRADYEQKKRLRLGVGWTCETCVAAKRLDAEHAKEAEAAQKRDRLARDLESIRGDGLRAEDLSLREAIELVSLARLGGAEDMSFIAPVETFREPLSPTLELDLQLLRNLYGARVLAIHPGSRPHAITLNTQTDGYSFDLRQVLHWALPLPAGGPSPARFVENVETILKSDDWPDGWHDEAGELQRLVALHECIQYLNIVVDEHGFSLDVGQKLTTTLRAALTRFSIGQVYNFIWGAAKSASSFYLRESPSKAHAANIIPGSIQRSTERSIANGWNPKAFRRDFRAPESALSHVLFTVALRLPDGGFNSVPPAPPVEGC